MRHATITGTGLHVPERVVPNAYFNDLYGQDVDGFLRAQRNIFERRYMADDEATSDLIVPAAQQALDEAGLRPDDLDLIVVATDTPDYVSPSTSAVVQHKLGATNAGVFDLNTACAGFVTALDVAAKFVAADARYRAVLVVGAYGMSKYLDFDDYKIATLFADGAGAVVVQPTEDPNEGVVASRLRAMGEYHDAMGIYAGGTFMPVTEEAIARKDHLLRFVRKIPVEMNIGAWPVLIREVLGDIGKTPDDVALYAFTQINIGAIRGALDALGQPHDKAHLVMDRFGYTGSAAIAMVVADAADQHKLKKGDLVLLVGSGGGVSMAAVALYWGYDT